MIEKNLGLNKLSFSLMYFYVLIGAKKYLVTAVFFWSNSAITWMKYGWMSGISCLFETLCPV